MALAALGICAVLAVTVPPTIVDRTEGARDMNLYRSAAVLAATGAIVTGLTPPPIPDAPRPAIVAPDWCADGETVRGERGFCILPPADGTDGPVDRAADPIPDEPDSRSARAEDGAGWDCRTGGNRVCGPRSGYAAGCYSGGVLAVPWTRYDDKTQDPLWRQSTPPC